MKKTFLGYDLGDGETIIDSVAMDEEEIQNWTQAIFVQVTMPDSNDPGRAIPTAYGFRDGKMLFASSILADPEAIEDIHINFKRCPTDLLGNLDDMDKIRILNLVEQGWPDEEECPELYTPAMERFRDSVVTFTNGIFRNAKLEESLRAQSIASDEIVICVGHPTRWNDLDVAIYKAILAQSVLDSGTYAGIPATMLMAAESRAAFLYVKDQTSARLPKDTCALLIDIGSSTIDLTAMTADSRNHQYNNGSNYLGARSIDFIIREWYLNKLHQNEDDWFTYQTMNDNNPGIDQALTLSCRMAKESVYTLDAGKAHILFIDFPPFRLSRTDIDEAINNLPIGGILQKYIGIPEEEANAMGKKTWPQLFREFLTEQRDKIAAQNLQIGRVILTGSASKMPFVGKIVQDVFNDLPADGILKDMNPSRSISMGLALVGPSNEKSNRFQNDLAQILEEDVPSVIDKDIPDLAQKLSIVINNVMTKIVFDRIREWRSRKFTTLNDMMAAVEQDCSAENINDLLQENIAYREAVQEWMVDVVGQDIAKKLSVLCEHYGVSDVALDSLNVLKIDSILLDGVLINPVENMTNIVVIIIRAINLFLAGLFGVVIAALFSSFFILFLASFLYGVVNEVACETAIYRLKQRVAQKTQNADLPQWIRDRMTDEKISQELQKADIPGKIEDSINQEDCRKKIVAAVEENLNRQILKRMEDIKYVIESR